MLKKGLYIIFLGAFLFSSCCKKVNCEERDSNTPSILFKFNNLPSGYNRIVVYTLQDGAFNDSLVYYAYYENSVQFRPYRFLADPNVKQRKFVVKYNSKADTIYNVNLTAYTEQILCNSCFLSGKQYSTLWRYENFSFQHKNRTYQEFESIMLDY
jgi:hypothetical protein